MSGQNAIYLRKSRSDLDSERNGEDTLARHEHLLMELAKQRRLNITDVYREVVSGDTIAARPQMQMLLSAVEQGVYDGVLVVEVERLARGDTIDQGIVAQTFKFSNTKIITPTKIYDPNNEFDEEYFEFGLFMSRREYKTINRRLQRGKLASVKEGKYVGSHSPYGYRRVKLQDSKGYTLAPFEDEAKIIRMIYELYVVGEAMPDGTHRRLGVSLICRRLNQMHVPTSTGAEWSYATVKDMIRNPIYDGKIRWGCRPTIKKMVNGSVTEERARKPKDEWLIVDGLHEPLVEHDMWMRAQELIDRNPPRPVGERDEIRNPLAGLIICGMCGRSMIRRPKGKKSCGDMIICQGQMCKNVGSYLDILEEALIESLKEWLDDYKLDCDITEKNESSSIEAKEEALKKLFQIKDDLGKQLDNIYTFFEQGIYSTEQFLGRSRSVAEKRTEIESDIEELQHTIAVTKSQIQSRIELIPKVESILSGYFELSTPQAKNDMLKEVLEKVIYTKTKRSTKNKQAHFELLLYPKLPHNY